MKKSVLRKYATLIATVGVNVQKGQEVFIAAELDQPGRAREEQKLPRAPKLRMLHSDRLLL